MPGESIVLACAACQQPFTSTPRDQGRSRKYCSVACSHIGRRASTSLVCPRCGKSFEVKPAMARNRTYCSYRCLFLKHGGSGTPEHRIWKGMHQRCGNPNTIGWKDYGGRGISVCQQWESFPQFLADMGPRPSSSHSLDRIDVNGNYEPGNVRWASTAAQGTNRRNNRLLTYQGRTQTITEWAGETGINLGTLRDRLEAGWTVDRALTQPAGKQGKRQP